MRTLVTVVAALLLLTAPASAADRPLLGAIHDAIGGTVKPGTPMRIRSLDPPATGFLRLRFAS